jgi:hypothetical protein
LEDGPLHPTSKSDQGKPVPVLSILRADGSNFFTGIF